MYFQYFLKWDLCVLATDKLLGNLRIEKYIIKICREHAVYLRIHIQINWRKVKKKSFI